MSLILVTKSANAPAHPYDGQVWVDMSTPVPVLKVYDAGNTTWINYDEDGDIDNLQLQVDAHADLLYGDGVPVTPAVGAYVDGVRAVLTPASAAVNSELTFTAVAYGTAGHAVTVAIESGDATAVEVDGNAITITAAAAATAAQIKAVYDAVPAAVALATVAVEGDGAGETDDAVAAPLANGVNCTAGKVGTIHIKADGTEAALKVSEQVWKTWALA